MRTSVEDLVGTIEVKDYSPLSRGDSSFAVELRDAVVELSDDDLVKAIVLRTRGDFAPAAPPPRIDPRKLFTAWPHEVSGAAALYQAVTFSKKVVITEVSGECLGAGSSLVLASDLTVASDDARFGSPFRGHPEANFVLAALTIRLNRAKAWVLRDTVLDATTAYDYGLVNEVVPTAELRLAAEAMGARVARMPLDGVVMSKMLQQPVLDVSGVGREYDMTSFYAAGLELAGGPTEGDAR
jgi:enoyl-CoA hydratase/carnithine racemase